MTDKNNFTDRFHSLNKTYTVDTDNNGKIVFTMESLNNFVYDIYNAGYVDGWNTAKFVTDSTDTTPLPPSKYECRVKGQVREITQKFKTLKFNYSKSMFDEVEPE